MLVSQTKKNWEEYKNARLRNAGLLKIKDADKEKLEEIKEVAEENPEEYKRQLAEVTRSEVDLITKSSSDLIRLRRCSFCVFKPIKASEMQEISRCQYFNPNRPDKSGSVTGGACVLDSEEFVNSVDTFLQLRESSNFEALKHTAAQAYHWALQSARQDQMTRGSPGLIATKQLELSMNALKEAGKLDLEKKKVEAGTPDTQVNIGTFNISELIKEVQRNSEEKRTN